MGTAILEISDGTNVKTLLAKTSGFFLADWNPAIAGAKRGGVFQSSSLSEGRRLAVRKFANATETFNLKINNQSQDSTIADIQDLINLLENAIAFSVDDTNLQPNPVFIKAKASCETNERYALIISYSWGELDNPYAQPFFSATNIALMDNIILIIERGHWLSNPPGESDCVLASGVQEDWIFDDWTLSTGLPVAGIADAIELSTSRLLFAEDSNSVWRSDDGSTWLSAVAGAANISITSIVEATGGAISDNIYAISNGGVGAPAVLRSIDSGVTFSTISTNFESTKVAALAKTNSLTFNSVDNLLYAHLQKLVPAETGIFNSADGITWTRVFISNVSGGILAASDGFVYAISASNGLIRSSDGTTWIQVEPNIGRVASGFGIFEPGDGFIYASDTQGLWRTSNGVNWSFISITVLFNMILSSDGRLYGGTRTTISNTILVSDNAIDWKPFSQGLPTGAGVGEVGGLLEFSVDDDLYAGFENSEIFTIEVSEAIDLGRIATCTDEIRIANKQNIANLTDIKIEDGGVFTDIFPITIFPQNLLPVVPALNDAIYFGINDNVNDGGPFSGLVFDIDDFITTTVSYTILWQYSDGVAGWPTLSVRDNTKPTTVDEVFSIAGVNSVHWEQPSDWVSEAVDGVTALWVRAKITASAGILTTASQQNRNIYAITQPFVNVAQSVIAGEIPAIFRQKLQNQSDKDGRGGNAPNLWDNRIICGLRSVSKGVNFQAYINVSDEQNPLGITVTDTGANSAFAADATAPTGRNVTYNPAGVEAMTTQVTISLGPTIARDFYGNFHVFLRAQNDTGAITDFDIQLQFVSGSGGIEFTTQSKQLQTNTAFELLDFGLVKMPVGGRLKPTDLGDTTEIRIQASAASGTPNLSFYDVILIPTDEWAGDFVDFTNNDDSIIGFDDTVQKLLDIDSITNPKVDIQSLVRLEGSEQISSIYNPISPDKAILQANAQQRLWFLAAQTDQTGILTAWIAPPEIAHSFQGFSNDRWLTMRGLE